MILFVSLCLLLFAATESYFYTHKRYKYAGIIPQMQRPYPTHSAIQKILPQKRK
jgi:hypothetical protein